MSDAHYRTIKQNGNGSAKDVSVRMKMKKKKKKKKKKREKRVLYGVERIFLMTFFLANHAQTTHLRDEKARTPSTPSPSSR